MTARQSTESLERKITRAAEIRDIELDAVRVIDADVEGQRTFRVLETDAPEEVDQVGFQITYPDGPTADMIFGNQLEKYMDSLREHVHGESSTDDSEMEDDSTSEEVVPTDGEAAQPTGSSEMNAETIDGKDFSTTVSLEFDSESIAELQAMLEETLEDVPEDVDERLDDIDTRLSRLEDAIGGLADLTAQEDES